jgi:mannose-6-phosphate isomerase-like protein (cupin superfamily)
MTELKDADLAVERQDVFDVMQLTRDTALESLVGVDWVVLAQGRSSSLHRHNRAETVLWFVDGAADIVVGDRVVPVVAGDRLRIGKGVAHAVRTPERAVTFISVQSPPILDESTGTLDLERLDR